MPRIFLRDENKWRWTNSTKQLNIQTHSKLTLFVLLEFNLLKMPIYFGTTLSARRCLVHLFFPDLEVGIGPIEPCLSPTWPVKSF